jgi:multiple sugar transport system permease protein
MDLKQVTDPSADPVEPSHKPRFLASRAAPKKTYSSGVIFFLAPAVIVLLAVGIFPLLFAVWNSLHEFILSRARFYALHGQPFLWFQNYLGLVNDAGFRESLFRTFVFLLINLPIQLVLGLIIALLLHKAGHEWLKNICRVSLVIPLATTLAVVGLMGRLMFNSSFGVVNYAVAAVISFCHSIGPLLQGHFQVFHGFWRHVVPSNMIDWLGNPNLAFATVSIMDCWQWTPFCALVLLSSLTLVPPEIEEAAKLETDKWWHVLWRVQLPFLLPGITAILILRTADILKMFDVVYTMTQGGPGNATDLISVYVQRVGFRQVDQGVASAQAIVLLIITIILSRIYIRYFYREI